MNITITARHFEASDNLKQYATDSVDKLNQFFDRIISCDIILRPSSDINSPQKVEMILKVPKKVLKATESAETYEKAISEAVDVLTRQLKRYKQKLNPNH